jgi:hypothetical protein
LFYFEPLRRFISLKDHLLQLIQCYDINAKAGHLKGDILYKTCKRCSEFNKKTKYVSTILAKYYFKEERKHLSGN